MSGSPKIIRRMLRVIPAFLLSIALMMATVSPAAAASLEGGRTINPTTIQYNGYTVVTYTFTGLQTEVQAPIDIELLLDDSGSMGTTAMNQVKAAAKAIVDAVDKNTDGVQNGVISNGSRVGVITFSTTAIVTSGLSSNATAVKAAIDAQAYRAGNTATQAAFNLASSQLAASNPSSKKVIVIFTDGQPNLPSTSPGAIVLASQAAAAARAAGTTIYCVGLGAITTNGTAYLNDWATDPNADHVFLSPSSSQLLDIATNMARSIVPFATNMTLVDVVNPDFVPSDASANKGSVTITGNTVTWSISTIGAETVTMSYKATHLMQGVSGNTQVSTSVTYHDDQNNVVTFPNPSLTVEGRPTLPTVTIASSNANPVIAIPGDTVTVAITASESITAPTVTIAGQPATVTGSGTQYSATRVMQVGDPTGPIAFNITNYQNTSGVPGGTVSATTNGSSVNYDGVGPTAPQITIAPTTWTNGQATVTIVPGVDSGSGTQSTEYQLGTGAWTTYSGPFQVGAEGQTVITARSKDAAGNLGATASATARIDLTPPTAPAISANPSGWTSGNVTVTVTSGTDALSGVAKSQYKIGAGAWTDYSAPITVTTAGQTQVSARTIDNAGNAGPEASVTTKIDGTGPSTPAISLSATGWSKAAVTATITGGTDDVNGSGTAATQYKIGAGGTWTNYASPFSISTEGATQVFARTLDVTGNSSAEASATVQVDLTAPVAPTITASPAVWTNGNVTVTVTGGSDTVSGLAKTQYKVGAGGAWTDYTAPVAIADAGQTTVFARSVDNAGNTSSEVSAIAKIDHTAPAAPAISADPAIFTTGNVTVTVVSGADNPDGAGVMKSQYKIGAGAWTDYTAPIVVSNAGLTQVFARTIDNAGNTSGESQVTAKIDRAAPSVPAISADPAIWTSGNVTITITGGIDNADGSGVAKSQYKIGVGAWTDYTAPVIITDAGQWMVLARTLDNVGNTSGESQVTAKIDKTGPAAPAISAAPATWTNGNVIVAVTNGADNVDGSGVAKSQYKIGGGAWMDYSAPVTITTAGLTPVVARTIDNAGNAGIEAAVTTLIDRTGPSTPAISLSPTGWSKTAVTVTVTGGTDELNGSGTAATQYKVGAGGTWTNYTSPFSISTEGSTQVFARTLDVTGNSSTEASATAQVDVTAPVAPVIVATPAIWTNGDVTVTVTGGSDTVSGLAKTQYKVGTGGAWTDYTAPVAITVAGQTTVFARSVDNASNTSSEVSAIAKIDRTAPAAPAISADPATFTTGNVAITVVSGTDNPDGSGTMKSQYKIGAGAWTDYTAPVVVSDPGLTPVSARTLDNAGNTSGESQVTAKIDRTAPSVPVISAAPTIWTNGNVTVTITGGTDNADGSGIAKSQYKIGAGAWTDYTSPVVITDGGQTVVSARTIDNVGNASGESQATAKIDRSAPAAPAISADPATFTSGNVNITVVSGADNEGGSGTAKSQYKIGAGGTWTDYTAPFAVTTAGQTPVFARSIDIAGNTGAEASVTAKIDRTAPTAPAITASPAIWTNGNVAVTVVNGTDNADGSGVAKSQYKVGSAGVWTDYTGPVTIADVGQTIVFARTVDNVGNAGAEAAATAKIDRTAPVSLATAPAGQVNGWYKTDVAIPITATDPDGSGVKEIRYRVGAGTEQVVQGASATANVTQEGTVEVTYWAIDVAANVEAPKIITVKLDKSNPVITSSRAPLANGNGWNAADVVVTFAATDAFSGVDSVTPPVTISAEGANQSATGTANDKAGNSASTTLSGISIDKSAPTITGAPTAAANVNGWYKTPVTVHFTANDPISGIATVTPDATLSLEGAAQSTTGSATDKAGNSASATVSNINIDKTAPQLTFVRTAPNGNGWNNQDVTVTFAATDGLSGIESLTPPTTTLSGDGQNQTVTATAVDKAGNTAAQTVNNINIDKTAPTVTASRTPAANSYGWANADVKVHFTAIDPLSGIETVSPDVTVTTEAAGQTVSGTATDKAGNSASTTMTGISIDKTMPTLAWAAPAPVANAKGWNNTDVTIAFTPADAHSGVAGTSKTSPVTLNTEGSAVTTTVDVTDKADNKATFTSPAVKIDKTAPQITFTRTAPNAAGWNNGPVTVTFQPSDAMSGIDTVTAPVTLAGEGAGQMTSGTAKDNAGNSASIDATGINIDLTAPAITYTRTAANAAGWNNGPVTVTFAGTDALSGIATVTAPITVSSQGANQTVTGTAVDKADNKTSVTVNQINVDTQAPVITISVPAATIYATNETLVVSYSTADSLSGVATTTATLNGNIAVSNGQSVSLADKAGDNTLLVTSVDKAGNTSTKSVTFHVRVAATIDVDPNTLNVKSQSDKNAVTVYVEFTPGYDVTTIDLATVKLNVLGALIPTTTTKVTLGDYDGDGKKDATFKFDRQAVIAAMGTTVGDVKLTLTGKLSGGNDFLGTDTIKVINPGK